MEGLTHTAKRRGLLLDPRTKLLMLITVTSLMLSTGNSGVMNIVKPVLSVLPFILLLTEGRWKTALKYLVLYAVCFALERVALYCLSGLPAFLLLAVCAIMTRFAPGIMMGAFLIASTSVSDFMAAMKRMHVSEKIVIPLSVIFRFFTSVGHPFPAVCIRTSTERPEALDKGCFVLAGIDEKGLLQAVATAVDMDRHGDYGIPVPDYLDKTVSTKVVKIIQSYTGIVDKFVWRK